ncbi:MAG: cytochrome c oxidase assembly factor Coa1 family protein [Terriglobales bacterium]
MRKTVAITMGILVAASCIPWLRHQHFFSIFAGVIAPALAGLLVFGGLRAVSASSTTEREQSGPARPRWLSRRRLTGLLVVVLLGVPIFVVAQIAVRRSDAYNLAVITANRTPQFLDALGAPVREGWFSGFKWEFGNPPNAELDIPVEGSRRKGNLHSLAIKQDGHWQLTVLSLDLTQPDERIDLLQSPSSAILDR